MESFGIGIAGLGAAGLATLGAFGLAFRQQRGRRARQAAAPRPRTAADRLEALAAAQADMALRLDALSQGGAPEERLQAMAGQLLGLVRDKNATLETALAGLDQLRARMRALEQMGEPAEARALFETLQGRVDEVQAAQAAGTAALEARLAALAAPGAASGTELAERLVKLQESRDAGAEKLLARLGPVETRLGALEVGRDALKRLESRIEALQAEHGAARTELAGLKAEAGTGPVRALAEQLARLHAQKEALAEQLAGRIGALEAELRGRDPQPALDRLAERLAALETPGETPYAAIAAQLTSLYAQKDAGIAAVLDRLAPLEAKLAELEQGQAARDPQALLDRFAERLEAVQGRMTALEVGTPFAEISEQLTRLYAQKDAAVETVIARLAPLEAKLAAVEGSLRDRDPQAALAAVEARLEGLRDRLGSLEAGEGSFAEISAQLTGLYAQKDATVETVFARLAPLEAKLADLEGSLRDRDPQAALAGIEARLEALRDRLGALEADETNPFAEISEQLTRLYAQKDATVETVFARLAPLEARLAEIDGRDPRAALDRFTARLEGFGDRLAAIEDNPFAELSEKLTQLYSQKDATVETVFARLAPLEARLAELAGRDPQAALDGFAAELARVRERLGALEDAGENPGENPYAAITEELTRLYAQKDATVETVFARLAPLEAKLAQLEQGQAERDPSAVLDRFAERLGALEADETNPFAEISEQLTRLYAQKDATVETVFARLAPLEARLAELEGGVRRLAPLAEDDPRAALDGLRSRIEALQWSHGETAAALAALQAAAGDGGPLAEVADQLTRLYAQKDAGIAALLTRLQPLEARLAAIEARPWDPEADTARAEAQAIAVQLIAAHAAAEQTALFADRLSYLEASLPRLSPAQLQALVRRGVAEPAAAEPERAAAALDAVWTLPRIVSLHHK